MQTTDEARLDEAELRQFVRHTLRENAEDLNEPFLDAEEMTELSYSRRQLGRLLREAMTDTASPALINQNIPIWSFLCGDHGLAAATATLDDKLLSDPNFLDPAENQTRLDAFKTDRAYILPDADSFTSFSVIQLSPEELRGALSPFTNVNFGDFADHYSAAGADEHGFSIPRADRDDLTKGAADVLKSRELEAAIAQATQNRPAVTLDQVTDSTLRNEDNLDIALHRGMVMRRKDGQLQVMDGSHRLTSWLNRLGAVGDVPEQVHAFYFEEQQPTVQDR
jgi:hypothetical protein